MLLLLLGGMLAVWPAAAMSPAVASVAVASAVVVAPLRHLTAGSAALCIGAAGSTAMTPEWDAIVGRGSWRRWLGRGGGWALFGRRRGRALVIALFGAERGGGRSRVRFSDTVGGRGERLTRICCIDFFDGSIAVRIRLAGRICEGVSGRPERARATAATMGTSAFVHLLEVTMWTCAVRANSAASAPVRRGRGSATRTRQATCKTHRRVKRTTPRRSRVRRDCARWLTY